MLVIMLYSHLSPKNLALTVYGMCTLATLGLLYGFIKSITVLLKVVFPRYIMVSKIGIRKALIIIGIVLLTLSMFANVVPVNAWEKDTHFYLTYYLAIATCFEPSEAYLIALGDWSVDTFSDTSPLPTFKDIKNRDWSRFITAGKNYHALGEHEEVTKRYEELRAKALDGLRNPADPSKALVMFGVYLHYRQDMVSHRGYKPPLGHALASILNNDPDSLATDPTKTYLMVNQVLDDMIEACNIMGRQPKDPRGQSFMNFINKLIKASDPTWKRRRTEIALAIASTLYGGPIATVYRLYRIYKLIDGEPYHKSIIEHNARLIGSEIGKLWGTGPVAIPPPHTIDVNALMSSRGGRLKYLGVSDPPDIVLLLNGVNFTVTRSKLRIDLDLTVYNAGDAATQNISNGVIALLDENGRFIATVDLPGKILDTGDRIHYNASLTIALNDLPNGPLLIYGVMDGGLEDPYVTNNIIQLAFNATDLKRMASMALQETSTSNTSTQVKVTYTNSTVSTQYITTYTRTIRRTLSIPWINVEVDLTTLITAAIAATIVIALATNLRRR